MKTEQFLRCVAQGAEDRECWLWPGATMRAGHGKVWFEGGHRLAHRVVYELLVGPIETGLHLHHVCEEPRCVNPAHLQPITNAEHQGLHKRTYCKRGHRYDEANTRVGADGARVCRACDRENQRRFKQRKALANR